MTAIQPDSKWCADISAAKGVPGRCPFASVHRCPRYYASTSLLGANGAATPIDAQEDQRLLERWKRSDLWPVTAENETRVSGQPGKPSMFSNFCPEVSFDTFGWFGSALAYHVDETDQDNAHRSLAKEGATAHDWRWTFSAVAPLHYTECPLYSLLTLGVRETKDRPQIGFNAPNSAS
jgi:hypothetical protein